MKADSFKAIGNSFIQHGPLNNRIYVMRLSLDDIPDIIQPLDELAEIEGYTKICIKVPGSATPVFAAAGYCTEATVPFFFKGKEPAAFMAKYPDPGRNRVSNPQAVEDVLTVASRCSLKNYNPVLPAGFSIVRAHPGDAKRIAALCDSLFETYPFPIYDPDFITSTMKEGILYFCVRQSKRIAAVASCEINPEAQNAEMTDFATDRQFQGNGFAGCLLHAMENEVQEEGVHLAYTIARAWSYPINITFARAGYEYAGILPNNTNISGGIESMNVWYRKISTSD